MSGIELITQERQRQIDAEGWTPEHDDQHERAELTNAARSYAKTAAYQIVGLVPRAAVPREWPDGDVAWWRPAPDAVRNLVKAGALIAAEIDRIQRSKP